uniref:Uncharacterized protein n=1 Tax=Solanum lycopersicum TaxID=4081 RepID=A0A3Q7I127_SOLLC
MSPKDEKKPAEIRPAPEKTNIAEKSHEEQNAQDEKKLTKNNIIVVGDIKKKRLKQFKQLFALLFLLN